MPASEKKVIVYSLDFDSCLHSSNHKSIEDFLQVNKGLIEEIVKQVREGNQVAMYSGSNRVDPYVDDQNARKAKKKNGVYLSSFIAFRALEEAIKTQLNDGEKKHVQLEEMLPADTYNGRTAGASFGNFVNQMSSRGFESTDTLTPESVADESKISILYAQIHHLAAKYPDKQITFTFYDDNLTILKGVRTFYQTHPHLVPTNVTFRTVNKLEATTVAEWEKGERACGALVQGLDTLKDAYNIDDLNDRGGEAFARLKYLLSEHLQYAGSQEASSQEKDAQKLTVTNQDKPVHSYFKEEGDLNFNKLYEFIVSTKERYEKQLADIETPNEANNVVGTGEVDKNYDQTVRRMVLFAAAIDGCPALVQDPMLWFADKLDVEGQAGGRKLGASFEHTKEALVHFNAAFDEENRKKIEDLLEQYNNSDDEGEKEFIKFTLHNLFYNLNAQHRSTHPDLQIGVFPLSPLTKAFDEYFKGRAANHREFEGGISQIQRVTKAVVNSLGHKGHARTDQLSAAFKVRQFLKGEKTLGLSDAERDAFKRTAGLQNAQAEFNREYGHHSRLTMALENYINNSHDNEIHEIGVNTKILSTVDEGTKKELIEHRLLHYIQQKDQEHQLTKEAREADKHQMKIVLAKKVQAHLKDYKTPLELDQKEITYLKSQGTDRLKTMFYELKKDNRLTFTPDTQQALEQTSGIKAALKALRSRGDSSHKGALSASDYERDQPHSPGTGSH